MVTRTTKFRLAIIAIPIAALLIAGTAFAAPKLLPTGSSDDTAAEADETAGESSTPDPDGAESTTSASPSASSSADEQSTKEEIALEAARIMTTWRPAEDFNQTASEKRAADLMTEERAEKIIAPERPATGAEWREAAEREAVSEPHVELMPHTEARQDAVSVSATWRWVAEGERPLSDDTRRVFHFTFTKDDGEVLIHDYTWEDL